MKCVECGKEIGNNQKFCKYCGAPVKQIHISAGNTGQTVKCKECGAILKSGIIFCTQCGTPVSAIGDKTSIIKRQGKAKGGKAGKVIIAFITVIVLALVAFIGYYFAVQYGEFNQDGREVAETDSEATGDKNPINGEAESAETEMDEEIEPEKSSDAANTDAMDVEAIALQIENQYEKIASGISFGSYDTTTVSEGIIAYSEQNLIKAIVFRKDSGEDGYAKNFYYDEDELFFAYYEDSDSHRFYFN